VSSLNKTDENLSASLLKITDLENSLVGADEKYRFMQKLRNYVSNICDFLQVTIFLALFQVPFFLFVISLALLLFVLYISFYVLLMS
jgi:hypothetical protein